MEAESPSLITEVLMRPSYRELLEKTGIDTRVNASRVAACAIDAGFRFASSVSRLRIIPEPQLPNIPPRRGSVSNLDVITYDVASFSESDQSRWAISLPSVVTVYVPGPDIAPSGETITPMPGELVRSLLYSLRRANPEDRSSYITGAIFGAVGGGIAGLSLGGLALFDDITEEIFRASVHDIRSLRRSSDYVRSCDTFLLHTKRLATEEKNTYLINR